MADEKELSQPEYRYERKFFIEGVNAKQAISLVKLHPAMFREIYPPRAINNLYLDSPWMDDYFDNVGGVCDRRKNRVRWYHALFREVEDAMLEFKVKRGLVGTKHHHPFPKFTFDDRFSLPYFRDIIRISNLPLAVKDHLSGVGPVLLNRYLRWYFATPDRRFRVTVDTDLSFFHLNPFTNWFVNKQFDHENIVLELKYRLDDDSKVDEISAGFPFRVTRSSKYVQGIERVYL